MRFIFSMVMALLCAIMAYFTLDVDFVHRHPLLRPLEPKQPGATGEEGADEGTSGRKERMASEVPTKTVEAGQAVPIEVTAGLGNAAVTRQAPEPEREKAISQRFAPKIIEEKTRRVYAIVLGILSAVTVWCACDAQDSIQICKFCIALLCLVGSGCVDYMEYRIPNFFPVVITLSGLVLWFVGYVTGQNALLTYVFSGVFAGAVCLTVLSLAGILSKGGIGMGDIKLFSAIGFLCGIWTTARTVFMSMVFGSLATVTLLALKKKTWKESLPFGPFILLGYMAAVWMRSY